MTHPLQTALRDAYHETYGNPASAEFSRLMAEALTRRGVVVQGDGQREALEELKEACQNYYDSNVKGQDRVEATSIDLHDAAKTVLSLFTLSATVAERGPITSSDRSDVEAVAPVLDGVTKGQREEFWSRFTAAIDYKLGEVTPGFTEYRKGFAGGLRSIARWMGYTPPETVAEIPLDGSVNVAILKDEIERLKLGWRTESLRAEKSEALMKKFTGALELRLQTYDELHAENDLSSEGEYGFLAFQVFARDLGFTILPAIPAQPLRVTIGAGQ